LLGFEIKNSGFVRWKCDFNGPESTVLTGLLLLELLDECTDQTMHSSVISITLVSVTIELITHDHTPMCLISVTLGFEIALTLVEGEFLFSVLVAVVLNDLLLMWSVVL
jgi:hypothetical protein